ncbi:alpha/beta hydrolase [Brevundimonas lutea]|uniref:alpha/beta hydrolase n=1 Tax=Brevundimonas lutea TaxID=2293980 RepID=UPI000F024CE9|nr:alpha/beta hydrolase [Brevundimonas lutea]
MTTARLISLALTLVLLGGCAGMIRDRVFLPSRMAETPAWTRAPEPVNVSTADGLTLSGLYWAPQSPHRDIVVYFHGNGGNLNRDGAYAEPLAADGRGLLMTSYRGYSGNPGRPTEVGLSADADAFLAEARRRLPSGGKLYLFGHSLGGAVALSLASRAPVDGVATLGTFGAIGDLAPVIVRGVMPDRFDNRQAIRRATAPVTLLHGTADPIVPFTAAEQLRDASGGAARVVPLPGADHHPSMTRLAPMVWSALEGGAEIDLATEPDTTRQ